MKTELQKLGVKRVVGESCRCSSSRMEYTYNLPCGLNNEIINHLTLFGTSSTSFEKHAILKIENADFSITGIRRLKQIKLIIKNINVSHLIDQFEDALTQWLEKS